MMLKTPLNLCLCALASALTMGCAGSSDIYPSLAVRDAERASGLNGPANPIAPSPITAQDRARIGDLVEQARLSHRAFEAAQPRTARLARAAGGIESDSRARALVAVANLSTLRGQTTVALASLDRLAAQAATQLTATDEIDRAQSQVEAMVSAQDNALTAIEAALR